MSLGSFGVVEFIRVHPGGRWVHSGSLGSFGCSLVVVVFILGRRDRLVSLGSFCVVGFVWGSFRVVGFVRVHPGGRWVHSGSFGSFKFALGVGGFVRKRWVPSGAPREPLKIFMFVGFIWVRTVCRWVH